MGEGWFIAATSSCSISRVRSRNSKLPGFLAVRVSPAEGCDDEDECWCEDKSELISIGALCSGGKLGMIISPGGSIISLSLVPGNSPCISLVSTCQAGEGTVRVVALAALASREGPPGSAGMHVHPFSSSLLARVVSTA